MTQAGEQVENKRALIIDTPNGREEIGHEEPSLTLHEGPLDEVTQRWLDATTTSYFETVYSLERYNGPSAMYQALAGIVIDPVLVDDSGQVIARVTHPQPILLAAPYEGNATPTRLRMLIAHTAGKMVHGKLSQAVPELATDGVDGQSDAPNLPGVLSTVELADGTSTLVAALYDHNFTLLEPHEAELILNTLKVHRILPVECSNGLSPL